MVDRVSHRVESKAARILLAVLTMSPAIFSAPLPAADPAFQRAWNKLDLIDSGKAKRGSTILFTPVEINAWCRTRIPQLVDGVRDARVDLGTGTANGSATVDFVKMRQGEGLKTNALVKRMIDGERPVKVSVRIESSGGRATVYLVSVELGGVAASGTVLDLLVNTFFKPLFPEAHINEPFELADNIESIEARPDGIRVRMKR